MLANACYPFSHALELETHVLNLLFQINTRQLFRPLGTHQWCPVLSSSVCFVWQTVLERFLFRYFSGPSSHHQEYAAVASDSDGISSFKFRVGHEAYQCPANAIFPHLEFSRESLKGTHCQCQSAIQYCSLGSRRRRDILTT